ncbi:MAG TPA: alpha/beta hydrolase [Acidobacteriota bacterium]|nr:alpha/beta hydrolase [Acidobacteriota bacterium]
MKTFLKLAGRFIRRHWVLAVFFIIVIGLIMTPYKLERMFVYYPTSHIRADPGALGLAYQDLRLVTADNVTIHGWFIPHEGADGTILVFHGNAGNIGDRLSLIDLLHDLGVNVLIISYRGYGKSEGAPFEAGLYRDARAAYDWWAHNRQPLGEKLIIMGESLGGAVAVNLAADVSPAGIILQSTFSSGWDMAKTMMPLGLLQPLLNIRFDSAAKIGGIDGPKLFIHGDRDNIVPLRLGRKLYELALPPKYFYLVPQAGHNDLMYVAGDRYFLRLKEFLATIE